ncbi:hypothetical protein DFH08DRAFT_1023517 [Mycena albidolilacea]|uniref:Uncharacterized protein n=1 Tax=Mycena albidolilacea TaxID=1033008 RepID=A0AAD6ZMP8_9AGAR|nr:hypothetical protein DFH08DRAFT_1023517 [Mycena albidolilacea]
MRVLAHLQVLEVVSAMRVVKYFCYEGSFLNEIFNIRKQELKGTKKIQHSQSSNIYLIREPGPKFSDKTDRHIPNRGCAPGHCSATSAPN